MRSMVYSGERDMAMGPERSKPLHNFKLPCLKWGNQRYLRCMKLEDGSTTTATNSTSAAAAAADHHNLHQHRGRHVFQGRRSPPSKFESLVVGGMRRRETESSPSNEKNNDYGRERPRLRLSKGEAAAAEGIEEVREKIMKDLKTAVAKIKDAIFRDEVSDDDEVDDDEDEFEAPKQKVKEKQKQKQKQKQSEESPAAVEVERRPWNLRTRRAACKAPVNGGGTTTNYYTSPMKNEMMKSPRVRDIGSSVATAAVEMKRPRPKFSVNLSKKEIEEDFLEMIGQRPLRRPKKRPRYVQKQLDSLFPGLWLTEVAADFYKVPEFAENGKR